MNHLVQVSADAARPPVWLAIVDGKRTGLAGCHDARGCPKAERCLRADSRLPYRAIVTRHLGDACQQFIPNDV